MQVNFDKSDRLIELLEDSYMALNGILYSSAFKMKSIEDSRKRNLYSELVSITQSDVPEEEKYLLRIKAYARAYNRENDLRFGEQALKKDFDEERVSRMLTKAYWQIQTSYDIIDRDIFLQKTIAKWFSNKPYKIDIVKRIIETQEPTVKDVEKEFWENCTDTSKINDWCNIYRERFKSHLKEIKEDFSLDTILFDSKSDYYNYFKSLRATGLITLTEGEVEVQLIQVANQINQVSSQIIELFRGFRAMTQKSKTSEQAGGEVPLFSNIYQYEHSKLKKIHKNSIQVLKCSEADFLFWFGGIGEQGAKIKWIKKNGKNPNKAALYQYCLKMNSDVSPSIINQVFDIEVKSNNNTANEFSFSDINKIFDNL